MPETHPNPAGPDPITTFRERIASNDALIRSDQLDIGRHIAAERTAIHTDAVRFWAQTQQAQFGYDRPFAVVALGGTGRAELTPFSDLDFALLFDDEIEGNEFLLELQRQVLHTDAFASQNGFSIEPLPFCLDDVIDLHGKQLNAFLDMSPVHDPTGLTEKFRSRIQSTYDRFEHFLHVRDFWIRKWEEAADRSEDIDRFDIKNDGLRIFLAAIWTLAGKDFSHSHAIYGALDDPRDLRAYEFLLRIRAFIHSRRGGGGRHNLVGDHPEDILGFEDFQSFGEMLGPEADERARFEFANAVRSRLLASRRRISRFAKGVIGRELSNGLRISPDSPIVFGRGGLTLPTEYPHPPDLERSRKALGLLVASQNYGVRIDDSELQNTFRNAGDWLVRVPELSTLFHISGGGLASALEFLCQIDGAADRLFPGYAQFEASLDNHAMAEGTTLRGKLSRRKLLGLEALLEEARSLPSSRSAAGQTGELQQDISATSEVAHLDPEEIAAIRLALFTKRLPLTEDDLKRRDDQSADLQARYSSGFSQIPLEDYYEPFVTEAGFARETIDLVQFLVANRRACKDYSEAGIMDDEHVSAFARLCQNENRLRALFVFTSIDRAEWESESAYPIRWFNTKELYTKAHSTFRPPADPTRALSAQGYAPDELAVLRDFGGSFFGGRYRRFANRFGSQLIQLAQDPTFNAPKASMLQDGGSHILGISARDHKGLAASICGAFWQQQVEIGQAHLFSSSRHGLALDFFHLITPPEKLPKGMTQMIENAIRRDPEQAISRADLPDLDGDLQIREWRDGQYRLRFEGPQSPSGALYALTSHLFLSFQADVFGLTAHYRNAKAHVSIFFEIASDHTREELERLARVRFV